jgi:hypothetical protein
MKNRLLFAAGLLAGLTAVYVALIRPRQMRWGATTEEATRTLPYDELVPDPTWSSTRAVTVEATPEQIWPWLVQVGWGRAGYYGYDLIDNGGKPSAWEILPEHQHLEKGTKFPMSPWTAMYCRDFEGLRWMLLRMGREDPAHDIGSFLYYLDPIDRQRTRLMIRMRDKYRWLNPPVLAMQLAVDVGDIFFQWKHLLGVKARAERMARRQAVTLPTAQDAAGRGPAAQPAPASEEAYSG